jgi:hypothetical protein
MAKTQELVYAVVGAGDFAIEKARGITKIADLEASQKVYNDFIKRGRTLSRRVSTAAPTKRAIEQTKTARTQIKAATTSITKAVRLDAKAARSAAAKVSKAS